MEAEEARREMIMRGRRERERNEESDRTEFTSVVKVSKSIAMMSRNSSVT